MSPVLIFTTLQIEFSPESYLVETYAQSHALEFSETNKVLPVPLIRSINIMMAKRNTKRIVTFRCFIHLRFRAVFFIIFSRHFLYTYSHSTNT